MSTNLKVVGASWMKTRISTFILVGAGLLCIATFFIAKIERPKYDGTYCATMYWTEKTGFNIEYWKQVKDLQNVPKGVGRICYKDSIYQNGWSQLEIETDEKYPDWVQAFGAGMLEGTLTWSNIYHHWSNVISSPCDMDEDAQNFCSWLRDTIEYNYVEMKKTAKLRASHDHYWHQIDLLINQLEGIYFGWQRGAKRARSGLEEDLGLVDFLLLNSVADIQDLKENFTLSFESAQKSLNKIFSNGRASMLLKLFPDDEGNFKFIMGHSAAGSYSAMLRVQKRYKFKFHVSPINWNTNTVPGTDINFSGYPGIVASIDDFYMIKGRNMHTVVGGVAIRNENIHLWNTVNNNYQIPLSFRIMTANRLGQNRKTWEKSIGRYPVTGSKQWIRIDLKRISLLQKLHSNNDYSSIRSYSDLGIHDIILLSEQVLNKFKTQDLTSEAAANWTSLWLMGEPMIKEIQTLSKIVNEIDYRKNIEVIIESNMTKLEDIHDFLRRSAFRGDLLGQSHPYGNIDVKLFSYDPVLEITDYNAISGPLFSRQRQSIFNNDMLIESLTIENPNYFIVSDEVNESSIEIISSAKSSTSSPARLMRNDLLAIAKQRLQNRPFRWSEVDDTSINHQGQPNEWNFGKVQPVWAWHS